MKYFLRSLKYLKPYRLRLTVAIVCVLFIAGLWGGGLGMLLPGAKILLDEDKGGLHGWAWQSLTNDKLKVSVSQEDAPAGLRAFDQPLFKVVRLGSIKDKGPAAHAGLAIGDWIVGVKNGDKVDVIRGDELLRMIAETPSGRPLRLAVYNPRSGAKRIAEPVLGPADYDSRALGYAVSFLPVPHTPLGRYHLFVYLLVAAVLITVLRDVFTFIQEYLVGTAIWQGVMDMRCENYNTVLHLPTTFFSEKGVSDATSRFIQDTAELARGQNTLLGKTMVEPAKAVATIVVAFAISWQLTLIAILAGPPAFLLIRTLGKQMHKASRRALESWSTMLEVLGETLIGIRVVKAYTMEGSERRRFFRVNRALLKQQNRMERLDASTGPMVECLGIIAGAGAAAFAGYLVFVGTEWMDFGRMEPTKFLVWMAALFAIFDPVRKLAKVSLRFQASDAAAQRIFAMQEIPQEKSVINAPTLARHCRSIQFQNVSFRYPGGGEEALRDINLAVEFGQRIAIVGPNGSGKTTLASLLPRLIDPTVGTIRIDGQDISQCSIRSLRRQIGLVTQDSVMFHATIGENVAYGLRRPKREAVLAAAKQAFVDEFVGDKDRFPAGYDTMVGEHGATLSGGQKQRISIARTILRDPAILIFDEATSQVDSDSEHRIQQAMEQFMNGRTCFLIAHRFATVMSADRIVVMNEGRIIDIGTHRELLDRCELYKHLYRNQLGGQ